MGAKSRDCERTETVATHPVASSVQVLIRKLVAKADEDNISQIPTTDEPLPSRVLIDARVDGVRCLLVRESPLPSAAISLSPREQEIARMIAKGYPNKTIAAVLEISAWTVGTHLRRIFSKLRVSSRAAMVAHLMETGSLKDGSKSSSPEKRPM